MIYDKTHSSVLRRRQPIFYASSHSTAFVIASVCLHKLQIKARTNTEFNMDEKWHSKKKSDGRQIETHWISLDHLPTDFAHSFLFWQKRRFSCCPNFRNFFFSAFSSSHFVYYVFDSIFSFVSFAAAAFFIVELIKRCEKQKIKTILWWREKKTHRTKTRKNNRKYKKCGENEIGKMRIKMAEWRKTETGFVDGTQ